MAMLSLQVKKEL
jgi:hypothetical protein